MKLAPDDTGDDNVMAADAKRTGNQTVLTAVQRLRLAALALHAKLNPPPPPPPDERADIVAAANEFRNRLHVLLSAELERMGIES